MDIRKTRVQHLWDLSGCSRCDKPVELCHCSNLNHDPEGKGVKRIQGLNYLPTPLHCSEAQQWTGKSRWQRLKRMYHALPHTPTGLTQVSTDWRKSEMLVTTGILHILISAVLLAIVPFQLTFGCFYDKKSMYDIPICNYILV